MGCTINQQHSKFTMDETLDIQHEVVKDAVPEIVMLKFADAVVPVFKEVRNRDFIRYGDDNRYPEYLTYLFNKSAKHNAIITGKASYIFGEGFENGDTPVNQLGETLNDISKKAVLDIEIYGGFRFEVLWNYARKIAEIYHVDYTTLRIAKEGNGYFYKERWDIGKDRDKGEFIPMFNPASPTGSQIYAYNEYRPMTRYYPLPSYIGCNNYIETDIEISKFYLSSIRNGMAPSKMIQFFKGDPPQETKRNIEASFKKKFAGAENAGKFILVFNDANNVNQTVKIDDLSGSDLDKMFVELNKTVQQEIFSGHLVTSPMLFGIKTDGQLGGNNELQISYAIFRNTYSNPKAESYSKEVAYIMSFTGKPGEYELRPTDPIGVQFDVKDVINALPKEFVFDKLNIPLEQRALPNIGSDNKPADATVAPAHAADESLKTNPLLTNLTAKQLQHVNRVVRQYKQGKMLAPMAKNLLRGGYGFSEDDINEILSIQTAAMSADDSDESIIGMFDACGEDKEDFQVIKSKSASFASDLELESDEEIWKQEAFKTYEVTRTEDRILELIRKDKLVTPDVIATTIGQSKAFVESKIASLQKRGYLEESTSMDGADTIIERTVPEAVSAPPPIEGTTLPTQISVKYSYEPKPGLQPVIPTTRPFCIKMLKLNRLYSRVEIEQISARLGYSVFDRKGGFWGKRPECRHRWVSHIVVKKGGAK